MNRPTILSLLLILQSLTAFAQSSSKSLQPDDHFPLSPEAPPLIAMVNGKHVCTFGANQVLVNGKFSNVFIEGEISVKAVNGNETVVQYLNTKPIAHFNSCPNGIYTVLKQPLEIHKARYIPPRSRTEAAVLLEGSAPKNSPNKMIPNTKWDHLLLEAPPTQSQKPTGGTK